MGSTRSVARWFSWDAWETNKLRKDLEQANAPKGKYQRLPDGTWGYPPEPDLRLEAYRQGWKDGWADGYEAGFKAAKEQVPA